MRSGVLGAVTSFEGSLALRMTGGGYGGEGVEERTSNGLSKMVRIICTLFISIYVHMHICQSVSFRPVYIRICTKY